VITQSFAGIGAAESLETFDARFEQIAGEFDGFVPGGGSLSTVGDGNHIARVISESFADGQYVQWVANGGAGGGGFIGGALRLSATGSGYGIIENGTQTFLNRYADAAFAAAIAESGSPIAAPAADTVCRFEFGVGGVAGAWRLLYGASVVASGTDNNVASGAAGLSGFNGVAGGLTDYEAGDLAADGTLIPRVMFHRRQQGMS
jgi:hypothetical protein